MRGNQLKIGIIITYINLLIGNIIPLIYTPIMLRILGQDEYGLYSLTNSIVGYISLVSLGLGATVVKYITNYIANDDRDGEKRVIGLFIKIYSILAIVCIVLGVIILLNAEKMFLKSLTLDEIRKMKILIMIMSINIAISFPLSVYSSVVISHQKYIFNKIISLCSTIVSPAINLLVLYMGYESIGLSLSTILISILFGVANIVYCHSVLKIKPDFKNTDYSILKKIFAFSIYIFIAEVTNMLYWSTDKIIIGKYIGTAAVSIYTIGATFNTYLGAFTSAISSVLFPKINIMVENGCSIEDINDIFIKIGRLQYIVVVLIISGFFVFGKNFILLWVGDGFIESYYIALLTMIPVAIPLIQSVGLIILQSKNMHKFRAISFIVVAIANVALSIMLIDSMGIMGCTIATFLSYLIGPIIIMNWYYWKKVELNIILFWSNILKMSMPYTLLLIFYKTFMINNTILNTWNGLLISIILYTIIYMIITWLAVLNDYEKNLIGQPVKKIKNRIYFYIKECN